MSVLFFLLVGLCVGSFLNVVIDRMPDGERVSSGRSHCDFCKRTLSWYELIPVFSFLFLHGKSRCCHHKLSLQYPLVESLSGVGFAVLFLFSGVHTITPFSIVSLIVAFTLFSCFLVIFISDIKYEIIPMEIVIIGIVAALIHMCVPCVILFFTGTVPFLSVASRFLTQFPPYFFSAIASWFLFFLFWFLSKGKAMGDGDMWLALLVGLVVGFPNIIVSLYAAFLTGALVGVILMIGKKKTLKSHIPFGPFLIIGMVLAIIWGPALISWWRQLW